MEFGRIGVMMYVDGFMLVICVRGFRELARPIALGLFSYLGCVKCHNLVWES